MKHTPEQIKGKIKNLAKKNGTDARMLLRLYMMECFLERIAKSKYKDDFIIKGGVLITALVGVKSRSTMDIDTSIKNWNLSIDDAKAVINEIKDINLGDGVIFKIKSISAIMDESEYSGIRISMDANLERLVVPIKIDISTGDVITPREIEYRYKLMFDDRTIELWSYNIETILAEKIQTILSRGVLNTRMRDYYDVHILYSVYELEVDIDILNKAFQATCKNRGTDYLLGDYSSILKTINEDKGLHNLWERYRKKYLFAIDIKYETVILSLKSLLDKMKTYR